jgi:hypothetical protein
LLKLKDIARGGWQPKGAIRSQWKFSKWGFSGVDLEVAPSRRYTISTILSQRSTRSVGLPETIVGGMLHFKLSRLPRALDIRDHKVLQMPAAERPILNTPCQL